MNNKVKFVLLAIGVLLSLNVVAADCINVYVKDKNNNRAISGAWVNLDGYQFAGTTNANGYLYIPNEKIIPTPPYYYHKINVIQGLRLGQADVTVRPGSCPSVTVYM